MPTGASRASDSPRWERLPTEGIVPEAMTLDSLSDRAILELMDREDRRLLDALARTRRAVSRSAKWISASLAADGRVFLVGAGTSGRLGVLEAAECPPTFGTRPEQIMGLIAGGQSAVFEAVEGAEDKVAGAKGSLRGHRLGRLDMVIGITASGVTPYVKGALDFAQGRGAKTVLVTCGARPRGLADLVIHAAVGPEILSGSTRLKAGTATKLLLNRMTLLAMIRLHKVYGPYMVDLRAGSLKLKDRAARIVQKLTRIPRPESQRLLRASGYHVKTAVVMGLLGVNRGHAETLLSERKGNLRQCLGDLAAPQGSSRGRDVG